MKLSKAVAEVLKVFPNATFDQDFDGQLIIYTDKRVDLKDNLLDFDLDEVSNV